MSRQPTDKYNILSDGGYLYTQNIKDRFHILEKYGPHTIINLCGGIPPGVTKIQVQGVSVNPFVISINIATNLYTVSRVIDFEAAAIDNNNMDVFKKLEHTGTTLFLNQVKAARKLGINQLNTIADFGPHPGDKEGYYRWGRLGYQMSYFDQQEFNELMHRFNRSEKNLGALLLTSEGCTFWKREGFAWQGKFYTNDSAYTMRYLKGYLKRKKIDFQF